VSADGSKVAYSHFTIRQNIWEIAIPETGSVSLSDARPVTEGNQIVENHGLSRDGRWLAFDSNLDGNQDIYVMPVEGGEPRQVTSDPGDDMSTRPATATAMCFSFPRMGEAKCG
jgi:tricorn protease